MATSRRHSGLAEQLAPYRKQFPATTPRIQYVAQFVGELGSQGADGITVARSAVLKWLEKKAGRNFPRTDTLNLDYPGFKLESFSLSNAVPEVPHIWAARIEHPDLEVPARTWSVEVEIALTATERGIFGARLVSSITGTSEAEAPLSVPGFVHDVCRAPGLTSAGRTLSNRAWQLSGETDLDLLDKLLSAPDRLFPVFVISCIRDSSKANGHRSVIDPDDLARRTLGISFVVGLSPAMAFLWRERVGSEWAVYDGAIRTYKPGLDRYTDDPYDHPYANPQTVEGWVRGDRKGPGAFQDLLIETAFRHSVSGSGWRDRFASFKELKRIQLHQERERAAASGDMENLQKLYEAEIANYKNQINEALNQAVEHEQAALRAVEEREDYRATNDYLLHEVSRLKRRVSNATGKSVDVEPPIPTSFSEMGGWVKKHLSGQIVVAERALREAKKSDFEDKELVYRSLLLLANEYRDMRMALPGDLAPKLDFENKCRALKLDLPSGAISDSRIGEQGEQYLLPWPPDSIYKRRLDLHIGRGTSKQTRHTLRIYFFWDDERRFVVVGWLPSHLDTRTT
jgi:hypothetical protein